MPPITTSTAGLLTGFLDVCNQSLARNRHTFPYQQLFTIYEKLFADRDVGIVVYEDDPNAPIGQVTIRYRNQRYEPVSDQVGEDAFKVKLKRSYLERVVENPDEYIRHPEKLDWHWLKSRLGLEPEEWSGAKVREVMTRALQTVPHDTSVRRAAELMRELDVGALPVIEGDALTGMITDRDIAVRGVAQGADPDTTPVERLMTDQIASCPEDVEVREAAAIMKELQVRRLLVLDRAERPIGILSLGDIARRSGYRGLAGEVLEHVAARVSATSQAAAARSSTEAQGTDEDPGKEKHGMDNSKLIDGLNEALNREISTAVRYMLQSSAIQGVRNQPLRSMYREEVQDEIGHAQYLSDKIIMLGGTPRPQPEFQPILNDVSKMIENDLAAEQSDIVHYKNLAAMAEEAGEIELKLQMEEQAADESRHAETLRRMQS